MRYRIFFAILLCQACVTVKDPQTAKPEEVPLNPGAKVNSSQREEILYHAIMEYDLRNINVFFFQDHNLPPTYGIIWIDGEIHRLNYDQASVDKWGVESSEQGQPVLHFVAKDRDGSELRILVDSKAMNLGKSWYGDWKPEEGEWRPDQGPSDVRVPALNADQTPSGNYVWISKAEGDFLLFEKAGDFFLLRNDTAASEEAKAKQGGEVFIFSTEDTDPKGNKINPSIQVMVTPVQPSKATNAATGAEKTQTPDERELFKAVILNFSTDAFTTSTLKVFNLGKQP